MDITPTLINTATTATTEFTAAADEKSPERERETPTGIQLSKPFPATNGVLKRHQPHHRPLLPHRIACQQYPWVVYKECLRNHAAGLGGNAVDGCGEFMPSPSSTSTNPTSLKCAACGCHRNFHRREPEDPPIVLATHFLEYQPHHRHLPLPPHPLPAPNRSPNSASPPPISSSFFPSAPHMLLPLSSGISAPTEISAPPSHALLKPGAMNRKRVRTKFSQEQKEKMHQFAERVGWKMQKRDDDSIQEFCNEIGVDRGVLKVWMHNNKSTSGKRDVHDGGSTREVDYERESHNPEMEGNPPNNNDGSPDRNRRRNDSGVNIGTDGPSSPSSSPAEKQEGNRKISRE